MKASRLIELLQKTIENHGDLDVLAYNECEEADGKVKRVKVQKYEEDGMPYYCKGFSTIEYDKESGKDVEGNEYVVLYNE